MRSSRAGQLGRDREQAEPVDERLERRARGVGRDGKVARVVGPASGRGEERALEIEPERLGAVGRARPAASARTRSAKAASSPSGAVTAVGRNEVTPRRSSRRAIPSSAARSPMASWPPQPWTWTSTNPGAR